MVFIGIIGPVITGKLFRCAAIERQPSLENNRFTRPVMCVSGTQAIIAVCPNSVSANASSGTKAVRGSTNCPEVVQTLVVRRNRSHQSGKMSTSNASANLGRMSSNLASMIFRSALLSMTIFNQTSANCCAAGCSATLSFFVKNPCSSSFSYVNDA